MKKLVLTGVLLLCGAWLHAQTITGRVYRAGTDTVIAGATVYYGGSMAGTSTNNNGRFELEAKQEQVPLIVSCIGYYSSTVTYQAGKPLIVYLKPKQEQLKMVTIHADEMDRSQEIAIFTREFIGVSDYARSCTITNIDDVNFSYNRKTETLTASCDNPLIIENKKLGYTITCYLDDFFRTPQNVRFAGNYIFKEHPAGTVQEQAKIKNNREDAYQYSRMQLIRALWSHTLKKSGFRIYKPNYKSLTEDSLLVRDSLNQQYLKLPGRIIITQSSDVRKNVTAIIQTEKLSFIDKDGYYGFGLKWGGTLIHQRIGDLLPFEYQSEKELKSRRAEPAKNTTAATEISIPAVALPDKGNTVTIPNTAIPDNKTWKQFASVVLMPDNASDSSLVVKKWQQPVRYKIYSRFKNKAYDKILTEYINQTLKKIAGLANCEIARASDDGLVNLYIVIGNPDEFAAVLPPDAVQYFSMSGTNSCYYAAAGNGFTSMVACINPGRDFSLQNKPAAKPSIVQNEEAKAAFNETIAAGKVNKGIAISANGDVTVVPEGGMIANNAYGMENDSQFQALWLQARQILLKSFGFAGATDDARSIFNSSANKWTPDRTINSSDTRMIKALYSRQVKSGMNEKEAYAAVKDMFTN